MANFIQTWNPFREMEQFRRDFDELFDRFLGRGKRAVKEPSVFEPPIESYIEGDKMVVRADLPGIDPKDVEITVTGDTLTIKGSREEPRDEKERTFIFRELTYGTFERSIALPDGIKAEDIKASYRDGVLELTAPAPKGMATRKVPIEIDGQ
ncbi:MAG TPA: Hsp20/alpha crystallin family protein [Terriglobales bacterium]|nr:Hsp20/alpha crystallin family protein [Terriglobales bacterium]